MGASGSKAAQNSARKFPTRAPGSAPPPPPAARVSRPVPGPAAEARSRPKASKDDAFRTDSAGQLDLDARTDPAFADRLRQMGVVQPNPTFSPSSIAVPFPNIPPPSSVSAPQFAPASQNTTLNVLEARRQLQAQANRESQEIGRSASRGRELLDITTIKELLLLRQEGKSAGEIESRLKLKPGVVARLGRLGIVFPS